MQPELDAKHFGMVPSEKSGAFYRAYHTYLKENGVDGVKVVCLMSLRVGFGIHELFQQSACFIGLFLSVSLQGGVCLRAGERVLSCALVNPWIGNIGFRGGSDWLITSKIQPSPLCGRALVRCVGHIPGFVRPLVRTVLSGDDRKPSCQPTVAHDCIQYNIMNAVPL